ncbi:MAG: transaldolase [Frankiaceae bacterium]|jgi:transaldolase|nr:transaldolase [Frankiaceae bacterium]
MTDVLAELTAAGVAIWLDDLSRERLRSGSLARLVADRHVVGVTTNPTIFQKALEKGDAYDEQVADLALRGVDIGEALRAITTYDVRWACDVLRPAYDASAGVDGRVSIEVDPGLARDEARTVAEARALWWLVDRPNLFVKIPATMESLPAISRALAEGISVNVTLIFSLQRYEAVMEAFLAGLEARLASGASIEGLESVASFFVSRVDTEVDHRLDVIAKESSDPARVEAARRLRGQAAIANARLAYEAYQRVFSSPRWETLAARGARPQRPLWASTGVKDPAYDDTRYVVELVAPGTVNTMPEPTLEAVADHGTLRGPTGTQGYDEARAVLAGLAELGIDYDDVVRVLEDEGVEKFEQSWAQLIDQVKTELEKKGASVPSPGGGAAGSSGTPA